MSNEFIAAPQAAPCQYFGRCGGCSLQNISNHAEYKSFLLKQALGDLPFGILHDLMQIKPRTRRRVTFKVNNKKLSFNQFRSKQMIAIADCLLIEDSINDLIIPINRFLKDLHIRIDALSITNSDTGIELLFYSQEKSNIDTDVLITEFVSKYNLSRAAWQVKFQEPYAIIQYNSVQLKFGNIYVDLPINSFLQVSKESSDLMTDIILRNLEKAKQILELYCGAGSFTIPMSVKANIVAIEGSGAAIKALDKAAKRHQLPIKVVNQDLYQNPLQAYEVNLYSQVVINPPRNGATPQIRQISEAKNVQKVILVSCSLENFIRDAKILLKGNFILSEIYPIDQFLYSNHLEIIGIFKR